MEYHGLSLAIANSRAPDSVPPVTTPTPPTTPTEWRLAEALAIQRLHGDRAHVWVAERTGALALAGDAADLCSN